MFLLNRRTEGIIRAEHNAFRPEVFSEIPDLAASRQCSINPHVGIVEYSRNFQTTSEPVISPGAQPRSAPAVLGLVHLRNELDRSRSTDWGNALFWWPANCSSRRDKPGGK